MRWLTPGAVSCPPAAGSTSVPPPPSGPTLAAFILIVNSLGCTPKQGLERRYRIRHEGRVPPTLNRKFHRPVQTGKLIGAKPFGLAFP